MTATQKKSSRRTFLKGVAAVPIGAAGIGAMSAPAAATDWDEVFWAGEGGDTSAVRYVVDTVQDHFSGLSDDDYGDRQLDDMYLTVRNDAEIIKTENERVLVTVHNFLENAKSVGYQLARGKMIERLNEGDSWSEARDKGEIEIEDYFTPTMKNLDERWEVMVTQIENHHSRIDELDGSPSNFWENNDDDAGANNSTPMELVASKTYEYPDGTEEDILTLTSDTDMANDNSPEASSRMFYSGSNENLGTSRHLIVPSNSDLEYEDHLVVNSFTDFPEAIIDLWDTFDDTVDDFIEFANGIQDSYQAGDIDTEGLVTPRDLFDMSSDDSDNPYAAADLAGLGLEINQDSSVVIDLLDDDETIEGDVYLSKSPIGESLEVDTVYDPTLSRSTDDDDEPDDDLDDYDGDENDPVPIDGLAYIAYNLDEGSTYGEINQAFEVTGAFDEDGEVIENARYEPSTGQQTTTTDIDELRDELESINDELIRVEEERNELATGGGGFLEDTDNNLILAVVAILGAFALFGGGN